MSIRCFCFFWECGQSVFSRRDLRAAIRRGGVEASQMDRGIDHSDVGKGLRKIAEENACSEDRIPRKEVRDRCAAPAAARTVRSHPCVGRSAPGCSPAKSCRQEMRLRRGVGRHRPSGSNNGIRDHRRPIPALWLRSSRQREDLPAGESRAAGSATGTHQVRCRHNIERRVLRDGSKALARISAEIRSRNPSHCARGPS